ncbi:hypothetical protein [Leeia sp.]|uniref:hypothetical protein n=1 Tax=Leeia sp. TaxID=2884678 RepID=UPI0035B472DA
MPIAYLRFGCALLLMVLTGAHALTPTPQPDSSTVGITECNLQTDEVPEPYPGATPTGYKGAWVKDPVWQRNVRHRAGPDGRSQYRLRWQRQWYASIEPIKLGANQYGYEVRDGGCLRLLNPAGQPYPLPPYLSSHIQLVSQKDTGWLYTLRSGSGGDQHDLYVRFQQGQLQAVSPHRYARQFTSSTLQAEHLVYPLTNVVVHASAPQGRDGHGVLNLMTLQEVLAPRWLGISELYLSSDDGQESPHYLLTDDGQQQMLFSGDGQRQVLSGFHSLRLLPQALPAVPHLPPSSNAAYLVTEMGGQTCRLYGLDLTPLLVQPHRLRNGSCLTAPDQTGGLGLAGETPDGILHFYTRQPDGTLRQTGQVNGSLAALTRTGNAVTRIDTPAGPRYRVYTFAAQPTHPQDFDDFRDLGCGFHEVRLGEQWLTLLPDGSTRTERYFPFSC